MYYKGRKLRPLWQIPIMLIIYPIYWIADKFINYMDNNW